MTVRFARTFVAVPLDGRTVWTRYYTAGEFRRSFAAAGFSRVSLTALGLCSPPPYMRAFAARHPTVVDRLHRFDEALVALPVLLGMGYHFLIVLEHHDALFHAPASGLEDG